jgi:hypothetical protein
VNIHYILDTEDDSEHLILAHSQAGDMLLLLQWFDADLRREAKYEDGPTAAFAEKWREALHRKMDEFEVSLGQ